LTLASFMKLLHSVFLGQPAAKSPGHPSLTLRAGKSQEVGPLMWVPQVVLALLCIVFGVFVWQVPLRIFIAPSVGETISIAGVWGSGLATVLLIAGLGLGAVIYLLGSVAKARQTDIFIGGEAAEDYPDMRVSGTQFYNTIKNIPLLSIFYALAERKLFDIYEVGTKIILGCNRAVSYLHNGVLPTYLAWCLLGVTVLFLILFK
jgi:NADH:ubiquinone oxidoreductase subunit 5 (subunit L)/multisubunit Na+/H+ antiporter MnhA subunit